MTVVLSAGSKAVYRIKFDENYAAERALRIHFEKDAGFSFAKLRTCGLVFFAVAIPLSLWWGEMSMIVASVVGGLCTALIPATQRWEFRRKMVKSSLYGQHLSVVLDEHGLGITEPGSDAVDWSAFMKAMRMRDGFLLATAQTHWWLPDADLTEGTADDVKNLIRENVRGHET
jgi:hypothetical protein